MIEKGLSGWQSRVQGKQKKREWMSRRLAEETGMLEVLTVHNQRYPLADTRRNAIVSNAEVSPHVQPADSGYVKDWSVDAGDWKAQHVTEWFKPSER